ncbi:hypothetical protein V8C42DRAFT_329921 [Trichoderma barbatum]
MAKRKTTASLALRAKRLKTTGSTVALDAEVMVTARDENDDEEDEDSEGEDGEEGEGESIGQKGTERRSGTRASMNLGRFDNQQVCVEAPTCTTLHDVQIRGLEKRCAHLQDLIYTEKLNRLVLQVTVGDLQKTVEGLQKTAREL